MNKKKLVSLAMVVIMIAILSYGSLAWFNDSDSVTNEFKVATSDDPSDPDDIFSVDVWEKVDTDGDGISDEIGKNADNGGAVFENILPGAKYVKEPVVENTGAYDQYIRVVVTLSDAQAWVDALGYGYDLSEIFIGHDEVLWTRDKGSHVGDELVYVYYLNEALSPAETATLFTHVQLPTSLTQQEMAELDGSFELTIRADAIQTENLGDGVDTAKEAFTVVQWGIEDTAPEA